MKKIILAALLLPFSLFADLKVAAAYPYIGELAEKIGGDHVDVTVLAPGSWDPHFVVPRPSLIAKLRSVDALIINGGELEIGWLPPLVSRANNAKIRGNGTLELTQHVTLIDVPTDVSRAGGDVHPGGNPHFHLDPHNILTAASAVSEFLSKKDPANAAAYAENLKRFTVAWTENLARWGTAMQTAKGRKVVQYHGIFDYFLRAYGIESIGTIEPLPGIPPSTRHTMELIGSIKAEHPCCILHDVYHPTKTAEFIASKTGIALHVVPHDVEATDEATDLVHLYDALVEAVTR
jgi:zinc/manganese transport system substrate-binding protein